MGGDGDVRTNASESTLETFFKCCSACVSCVVFFFRIVVPDNVARVRNKTSEAITVKCYSEDDCVNLLARMEATLESQEYHDFTSPATGERKFKVFVAKSGFAFGTYHTIEKGKLFDWDGTNLVETWL